MPAREAEGIRVEALGGCLGGLKELMPRGFKMTTHELLLQGRCAACARGRRK